MTEDEAKTKWCPFARVAGDSFLGCSSTSGAVNRWTKETGGELKITRCLGSACMAWRIKDKPDRYEEGIAIYSGFCGLAGKP